MATIAIVLKTTKKLSNDEYAVALRVTHERQSHYYVLGGLVVNQSLKFRCTKEQWKHAEPEDNGLGKFRKTFINYKECNTILENKFNEALKILISYELTANAFSFHQFEIDLFKKGECSQNSFPTLLYDYYQTQIKLLEKQQRIGLAGLFKENQSILKMFNPNALITDINFRFLENLEYWLRNERKNKDTSISVKMRNLQRIINLGIEDKLLRAEDYPFGEKKYSINKRLDHRTKKIAINLDKIGKLKGLVLKPGSSLYLTQQMFMFSYYCRGMNFIDMTYLKWEQVTNSHTEYRRRKTGGQFRIPHNEYVNAILEYFKDNYHSIDGYVFPILDSSIHITMKQQYTRKKTALKTVNDNLKKLAEMIGEKELKLTTNVGRHSYATALKRSGANTSYITEALGHATELQTQTYLAEFEEGIIEKFEYEIFNL